jgi:menaquinone-dependent protoporphyrinogen IX oxidase
MDAALRQHKYDPALGTYLRAPARALKSRPSAQSKANVVEQDKPTSPNKIGRPRKETKDGRSGFQRTSLSTHSPESCKIFVCKNCGVVFPTRKQLEEHDRTYHHK